MSEEKVLLLITVDYNDGDYATKVHEVSPETLEQLKPVFEAIKARPGHSWPAGEQKSAAENPALFYPQLTEDQIEMFQDFCPNCEYGFHTVEWITTYLITDKTKHL